MTTIVCDRRGMAGDSQTTTGSGTKGSIVKVHRIDQSIVGIAGDVTKAMAFLKWAKATKLGAVPTKDLKEPDMKDVDVLVLSPAGIFTMSESLVLVPESAPYAAVGSGDQAALAAMVLGCDPKTAVKTAAKVVEGTGGRVRYLELKD